MPVHRILIGLDGSPLAESVLATAGGLARPLQAQVTLLHVVHVPESVRVAADVTLDGVVERERRAAEHYLGRIAATLHDTGLAVHTAVTVGAGTAAAEIVRRADHEHSDVIALATHGRTGLQRWLHGSVADAVLHTTTRPLLLVRPSATATPPSVIRQLLVPLDGSPVAEEALPLACELACRLDVPLELLSVVEPLALAFAGDPAAQTLPDYPTMVKKLEDGAAGYLAGIAARAKQPPVRIECTATTGAAAETIAQHQAQRPGSLVVIGSHGRTGWRATVLGSVARRVVALAPGPVMVVPPAARAAK